MREQRTASSVLSDVSVATISLSCLPRTIQSTIDNFNLDSEELTESQKEELASHHKAIRDLLVLIQNTIYDTETKLENIAVYDPEKVAT